MSGWLLVFAVGIVIELIERPKLMAIALGLIALGLLLARYAARHFHGGHTHVGDSAIDIVAIGALLVANVLHPMVDGFSIYETTKESTLVGILFTLSVFFHECLRQWALIEAVKGHLRRATVLVVGTALGGIALGIGLGLFGTRITEGHEQVADLATIFAYTFIIGEFYFADHGHAGKGSRWFIILGLAIGALLTFFLKAH